MLEQIETIIGSSLVYAYMNQSDFEADVFSGNRDDYVSEAVLEFLKETADFRVIERSALDKGDVDQTEFVSVALPESADNYSDEELISEVKEKMTDGQRDVQKYQLRDGDDAPTVVEIWRHGSGYSAFALAE